MDKAQRDRVLLLVLGFVLVVVIAWWGLPPLGLPSLGTLGAEVERLRREKQGLESTVRNAQAQVVGLERIKKEREVLEAQLKELSKRLPSEKETPQILRKVEELTARTGLQLGEVRRRPIRAQELYAEIPMEVGVGGTYRELIRFADDLSRLDRLVTLSEVTVQRAEEDTRTGRTVRPGSVTAKLVAVVFQTLPEAPASGKP